jgi:hypothetical protein
MVPLAHRILDIVLRTGDRSVLNPESRSGSRMEEVLPDLRRFLAAGRVDYALLRAAPEYRRLCDAAAALRDASPPESAEDARAWWVNLYNALVIHGVIAFEIRRSALWEDFGFFRRAAYTVGGHQVSADDIEHGILRDNRPHPVFRIRQFRGADPRLAWSLVLDPRIHFALVCAANSCPAISYYRADRFDAQLEAAAVAFVNGGAVVADPDRRVVSVSRIFKWYQEDFGGRAGVLALIARHSHDEATRAMARDPHVRIRYQRYNWGLNHRLDL